VSIADLNEGELQTLQLVMGRYMKYRIEQLSEQGNDELLKECRERSGDKSLDDAGASVFILRANHLTLGTTKKHWWSCQILRKSSRNWQLL